MSAVLHYDTVYTENNPPIYRRVPTDRDLPDAIEWASESPYQTAPDHVDAAPELQQSLRDAAQGIYSTICEIKDRYETALAFSPHELSIFSRDFYAPTVRVRLGRRDFQSAIRALNSATAQIDLQRWSVRIQDLIDMRSDEEPDWTPNWLGLASQIEIAMRIFNACGISAPPQTGLSPRGNIYLEWRGQNTSQFVGLELLDQNQLGFVISSENSAGAVQESAADIAQFQDFFQTFKTFNTEGWL